MPKLIVLHLSRVHIIQTMLLLWPADTFQVMKSIIFCISSKEVLFVYMLIHSGSKGMFRFIRQGRICHSLLASTSMIVAVH